MPPTALPVVGPVDANGAPLGRRVAPFDTMTPTEVPVRAATDANGMTLGRRVAPIDPGDWGKVRLGWLAWPL
jgi:hypothetical protein